MYVEFELPNNEFSGIAVLFIDEEIKAWTKKHQIKYRTKIHKFTYRLCFFQDRDYEFFALTWNPNAPVAKNFKFKNPK